MAIETLTGVPASIESGDTCIFTETFSQFPASTWSASLVLNRAGSTTVTVAATASGDAFLFTLSATVTAAIAAGYWTYAIYVTASSQRATAKTGTIAILNNLAVTASPTTAQTMVSTLETALAALAATSKSSISFNGQSFSRASINEYTKQLTYWKAAVIREQQALAGLRGVAESGNAGIRFINPSFNP